jgi:SAM-dependent methyltransferase
MEFTGERVIPGKTDPDLFNEHLARYRFAETLASGRRVLDAGCGAGYGAALLGQRAESACGIDFSHETLDWASREYAGGKASFAQADCSSLPFRDASFDLITAFEVIEHLPDWKGFLAEARRVLTDSGQLLVSTPNRVYYQESRAEPNPYHVHEFDYDEFQQELQAVFPHVTMFLENHTQAISFRTPEMKGVRTVLGGEPPNPQDAHFFLAVCSGQPQFGAPAFLYVPSSGNVLREREQHVALLAQEVKTKSDWLDKATAELETLAKTNQDDHDKAQAAILQMEAELAEKITWAQSRDAEVAAAAAKIDELEARVIERSEWAQRLQAQLEKIHEWKGYKLARKLGLAPDED